MQQYKLKKYYGPKRIAHRGVAQIAPENTIESFDAAVALGLEGIEIDIQKSKDGEIVVVHDHNLTRLTIGNPEKFSHRHIKDMTWAEIQEIELPYANHLLSFELPKNSHIEFFALEPEKLLGLKTGFEYEKVLESDPRTARIPSFLETLQWLEKQESDVFLEVEIKAPDVVEALFKMLDGYSKIDKIILFSGREDSLKELFETIRAKGAPKGLKFGANIRQLTDENKKRIKELKDIGLYEVGLNDMLFDKADVDWLLERGINVFSNLGDYPEWWKRINQYGIKGFKTNFAPAYNMWYEKEHL